MPSQAMQDSIDVLRDRRQASASQAPPTLEALRAAFTPGDRLYPLPDDVQVTEVRAGGIPTHWLTAPGSASGRVLLFLHDVSLEVGEGLPHVYQLLLGTPEAAEATERIGKFLRARVR